MYNLKGGLIKHKPVAWALIVAAVAAGCIGARATDRTVAESGGSFVRVERDPSVLREGTKGHPASLSPERVRALLGGIEIESRSGPFLGEVSKEPLFDQGDLDFLAPSVSAGLAQAQADERVVFYLRQSGRLLRPEITTGAVSVAGASLRFTLGHFRRTDVEGLVDESQSAGLEQEVRGDPMFGVYDRGIRLFARNGEGLRGDADARSVHFRLAAGDLVPETLPAARRDAPAMKEAMPPATVQATTRDAAATNSVVTKDLQRQVKELTDSNQELRARLKETFERQNQAQTLNEELARLRQELADAKQLLADKVLELNRLQKKSGGTNEGKQ